MKCELCGQRESVVHVQQIVGNETVDLHLCELCAYEKGISRREDRIELSLSQLLTGLLDVENEDTPVQREVCPTCGISLDEFRKTGKIGCPECYTSFAEVIRAVHGKLAGSVAHKGKIPKRLKEIKALIVDRERLREQLQKAVQNEDYEAAAKLRDRIRSIERETDSVNE